MSDNTKTIYKKIYDAKKQIGILTKDSKNPFFKSNYLSLNGLIDAVDGVFESNGLLVLQPIEAEWVKTKIFDIDTGEFVSSEIHLPNITDPQKLGSAITYYRRYTLQSLLGLQAEDDDGNSAKPKPKPIKETLTEKQYNTVKESKNKEHAKWFLDNTTMTEQQNKDFNLILNS